MDDSEEQIEHTLYINRDVKAYRIPPRPGAGGHSSGTWRVDDCIFTGRLRVMARGQAAEIRLEDGSSGELFAVCPFTPATQSVAVEATADSSRYYVLRVEDPTTRRHAFLGIGFSDRGAAFDFNAALADHAKQCQRENIVAHSVAAASSTNGTGPAAAAAAAASAAGGSSSWQDPAMAALYKDPGDMSLKEGQTIRINVKRPASNSGGGGFLARAAAAAAAAGGGGGGGGGAAAGGLGLRVSSDGGGTAPVLAPPPVLLPPPGQPVGSTTPSPGAAAAAAAAGQHLPAAVTVASSEENWATFD